MNEFIAQFVLESREQIEQATELLSGLQRAAAPPDAEQLNAMFRAVHTLKGGAGIVEFVALERTAHALEDVLSRARGHTLSLTPQLVRECIAVLDASNRWLDRIEQTGEAPTDLDGQADALIARLQRTTQTESGIDPAAAQDRGRPDASAPATHSLPSAAVQLLEAQRTLLRNANRATFTGRVASAGRTAANVLRACGELERAEQIAQAIQTTLDAQDTTALEHLIAASLKIFNAAPALNVVDEIHAAAPAHETVTRTLRVDAHRIDALVRLTGELSVIKNTLGHLVTLAQTQDNALAGPIKDHHGALERLAGELQRAVLGVRVLPMRVVLQRLPRLVREMSANLGKPVELVLEGEETEADKAVVEMLFEPLLHVVRNAMDHGVERADIRAQRGKPPVATLRISAAREGAYVLIHVVDDGGGIDIARVRQVARARGVIAADRVDELTEAEILNLVFAPGFSTAEHVTEVSGRGVGMDAVRRAVERVGGQVTLESRAGQGAAVRFRVPFSAMMTQVLTVEAAGQMFGIPVDAVIETLRTPADTIESVGAGRAVVRRERTLPVLDLAQTLQMRERVQEESEAALVVVCVAGEWAAVQVDRVGERMEVMLKPLDGLLKDIPHVTGTTILGDGRVLLVLEMSSLMQ